MSTPEARPPSLDDTSRVLPGLDPMEPAVEALLSHSAVPITARPTWWSAWVRAFNWEPLFISSPDDQAIAPLASSSTRRTAQVQMLGGGYAAHARLLATDGRAARELADLVAARLTGLGTPWHLRLEHLPAQDPVAQRLAEILPRSHWRLAPDRASPYVRLQPGATTEDYLGRTSRKSHRRTERAFSRAGGTVKHINDPNQITALLPKLARIRRDRDHQFSRVSDLDSTQGHSFWSSVLIDHASRGELEVAVAHIHNKIVGYDVILLDGTAERLWDGRIAPEAEPFGVGRLLQDVALTRALYRGATELDLMRGVTSAKLRLATDVRSCSVLEAWSNGSQQRFAMTSRTAVARAKHTRDSHERLVRLWRAAKYQTVLSKPGDHQERTTS